jgi:hypothetical protein
MRHITIEEADTIITQFHKEYSKDGMGWGESIQVSINAFIDRHNADKAKRKAVKRDAGLPTAADAALEGEK